IGVRYKMFQSTGDPAKKPGVYITDLDVGKFADGEPGLYKVVKRDKDWKVGNKPIKSVEAGFAAINGLCEGIQHAATEILPSMLKGVYGDSKAVVKGYTLCYNPPSLHHGGSIWR